MELPTCQLATKRSNFGFLLQVFGESKQDQLILSAPCTPAVGGAGVGAKIFNSSQRWRRDAGAARHTDSTGSVATTWHAPAAAKHQSGR
jgi:hypothetical protein